MNQGHNTCPCCREMLSPWAYYWSGANSGAYIGQTILRRHIRRFWIPSWTNWYDSGWCGPEHYVTLLPFIPAEIGWNVPTYETRHWEIPEGTHWVDAGWWNDESWSRLE